MKRVMLLATVALAVAGCFRDTSEVTVEAGAVEVVPPRILNALPEGVAASDVLILDGCYYYKRGFEAVPIVRPDQPTTQMCLIF